MDPADTAPQPSGTTDVVPPTPVSGGDTSASGGETLTVRNPATGEIIAELPAITPADVPALVERARAVQGRWEAIGAKARADLFKKLRDWLWEHESEFVDTVTSEGGKPREDSFWLEWVYAMSSLEYWPKVAPKLMADRRRLARNRLFVGNSVVQRHVPHGVVGVIGPWNYPFVNSIGDVIPAMLAGNAVILKPASKTPLTAVLIHRGMREVGFPEDVLQLAIGPGPVGGEMVEHVDMVMFTGSTEVGRGIAAKAAERLIPCSLELGGKDPLIVLSDADVERAANHAVFYSLVNGGQTCMSIERIYVEAPVYDEFIERVVEKVKAVKVGAPGAFGTCEVGAMTVAKEAEGILAQIREAEQKGARVVVGGNAIDGPDGTAWLEPTVLVDVRHGMQIVDEETFGPTLQIMKVADAEEAVQLANDSQYGLAAAVFSKDVQRAEGVARRIEAGTVSINDSLVFWAELQLELGGWKQSGWGDGRHGEVGLLKYTKTQGIFVSRYPVAKTPQMFPYGPTSGPLAKAVKLLFRWPRS